MSPSPDPLAALAQLEHWLLGCAFGCPADVQACIDRIRAGLRARLDEPEDPLDDAAAALQKAQAQLQHYHGSAGEAIQYELTQAAANLGRARLLAGKG